MYSGIWRDKHIQGQNSPMPKTCGSCRVRIILYRLITLRASQKKSPIKHAIYMHATSGNKTPQKFGLSTSLPPVSSVEVIENGPVFVCPADLFDIWSQNLVQGRL